MQTKRHLFLLGFMGSGKSHCGPILAQSTTLPYLDLDDSIARIAGKSIPEIFAQHGEKEFRGLERDALRSLAKSPDSVVATGGGTPCFFDNLAWMNAHGTTVYLQAPAALLAERLWPARAVRPLLAHLNWVDFQDFIEEKLRERAAFYEQADIILDIQNNDSVWLEQLLAHPDFPFRV